MKRKTIKRVPMLTALIVRNEIYREEKMLPWFLSEFSNHTIQT